MTNRYHSYKPSGVDFLGDIPDHWDLRAAKYACRVIMGQSPSSDAYHVEPGERPFLQGNAEFGERSPTPKWYCDAAPKVVETGTLLLSVRAPVGALNKADQAYAIGRGLCGVAPDREHLDSRFAWWALHVTRQALEPLSVGSTYEAVSAADVGRMPIPIPPLAEQRAIADYLDTETARIDTLISKKRRLIELLAERKTLAAEDALVRLRESEKSIPLKYLVNESNIRCGTNQESGLLSVSIHHGVVPKNLESSNQAVSEDLTTYKLCHPGDIIVNRMRAFQGGLGVSPQRGIVSPDYTVLRVGSRASPRYLHFLMRSSWFVSEMTKRLRGIGATDQGQVRTPRINFADMGLIEVPVPSRDKQDELATDLTRQDA